MGNGLSVKNDKVHWEEELINLDDDIIYNPPGFLDRLVS